MYHTFEYVKVNQTSVYFTKNIRTIQANTKAQCKLSGKEKNVSI